MLKKRGAEEGTMIGRGGGREGEGTLYNVWVVDCVRTKWEKKSGKESINVRLD
jgi:hypothetical protein